VERGPYRLDGWLKPTITAFQTACDDPQVAWFSDVTGRVYLSLDGWRTWRDVSPGLMGAQVRNLAASSQRTFVLWADTDQGVKITRDGGLSWRSMPQGEAPPQFPRSADPAGRVKSFTGWRIPVVRAVFSTPRGLVASGPGGAYLSQDGENWNELKLWPEFETGAADYLHAYWMGRYYRLIK
jgi:hypothetical protein